MLGGRVPSARVLSRCAASPVTSATFLPAELLCATPRHTDVAPTTQTIYSAWVGHRRRWLFACKQRGIERAFVLVGEPFATPGRCYR